MKGRAGRCSGQGSVPQKKFKEVSRLAVALRGSDAGPILSPETPVSDGFELFIYSFVERQEPPKLSHALVSPATHSGAQKPPGVRLADGKTLKVTLGFLPLLRLCKHFPCPSQRHPEASCWLLGSSRKPMPELHPHSHSLGPARVNTFVAQNSKALPVPLGSCPSGKFFP